MIFGFVLYGVLHKRKQSQAEAKKEPLPLRFCCNCEHYMKHEGKPYLDGEDFSRCRRTDHVYAPSKYYKVTGIDLNAGKIYSSYCSVEREGICSDACGPEGKWYKAKETNDGSEQKQGGASGYDSRV